MTLEPDWQTDDGAVRLYRGDCLEVMPRLEETVDMIANDPPYAVTACSWDAIIPFEAMWGQFGRLVKADGAVVMTACGLFEAALKMSNPKEFRYEWIWDKVNLFTNQMNAKTRPMRQHENVLVFYKEQPTYNPQWRLGEPYKARRRSQIEAYAVSPRDNVNETGLMYPGTMIAIPGRNPKEQGKHPTQKPVALLEYLIKTYTNEGDTVLDNTFGSGTTAVACINTGRRFIGIERDPGYFDVAVNRCKEALGTVGLFTSTVSF